MADETTDPAAGEVAALQDALEAEHAAVWGYGVVGAALPADGRAPAAAAEGAHRDARDALVTWLSDRGAEIIGAAAAYELPFPVLSDVDAAALAVILEDGVAAAWVRVLDQAVEAELRGSAVETLGDAEVRAVGWRRRAGGATVTRAFPGLPAD